ncbi:hypothetical protein K8S17_04505, partial [bacterium]|nr:hypothetical protein [bacterium]
LAAADSTIVVHSAGKERIERLSFRDALPGEIVLAEGFKSAPGRKIAVVGGDLDISTLEGVVAVIADGPRSDDSATTGSAGEEHKGLHFTSDQTNEICDLIEKLAAPHGGQKWATRLFIDGEEVSLNSFVQDVMAAALLGMSTCLKDIDHGSELEFRCTRIGTDDES